MLNKHAPVKKVTHKIHKLCTKPWLTKSILISTKVNNELFADSKKNPRNEFLHNCYKKYRYKLTHTTEFTKKMHYQQLSHVNKNNYNKVWKIKNDIINYKNKKLSLIPDTIIDGNNKMQSNPFNISNAFNEYFANVGVKMVSETPP